MADTDPKQLQDDDIDSEPDDAEEEPSSPEGEQHRWRRFIGLWLAFALIGALVVLALSTLAFVAVLNQSKENTDTLTRLIEETQSQRGSLLESVQQENEQRRAALLGESQDASDCR